MSVRADPRGSGTDRVVAVLLLVAVVALAVMVGRAVFRQELSRADLQRQDWTVRIPRGVTVALERAGYR